ncbi:MAG: EVE domain-containing protein [Methylotetracoccus sp.]
MAAWVFQGNPDRFDIDDYVARYPELIYWRTPRHAKEISAGDRAFLWRSGTNAGAIAIGTVVEPPTPASAVRHPEALGDDLWRADKPDSDEAKTGIHLDEVRLSDEEGYVHRNAVKDDPNLSTATIITTPNGTVFPLDREQTLALERLWGLTARDDGAAIPAAATEGERTLRAHRRRERSNILRDKKLAEVRAAYGKCVCALCGIDETTRYPAALSARIFEVHHIAPLSKAAIPVRTTLADLTVLCANCHRAVHATPAAEENYSALAIHLQSAS